jgi:MYXO-CTERM domain-containing protein
VITGGTTSGLVAPVTGGSAAARGGAAPGAGGTSGAGGSSTTGGGPASSNSGQGGSAVTGTSGSSALAGGQARNDLPEIANDDSGCSCTIPNQGGARGGASELVGLLGMVLLGWRKRRRPASTRP